MVAQFLLDIIINIHIQIVTCEISRGYHMIWMKPIMLPKYTYNYIYVWSKYIQWKYMPCFKLKSRYVKFVAEWICVIFWYINKYQARSTWSFSCDDCEEYLYVINIINTLKSELALLVCLHVHVHMLVEMLK